MLYFVIFILGIITGFFDSVIGAGGLISVPALIFLGLPAQVAIATDRLGVIGQGASALFSYGKAKKIVWKYVPIFTVLALVGSFIGAHILLSIYPKILQNVIAVLLLVLLPLIFFRHKASTEKKVVSKLHFYLGLFLYFCVMIFGAFFGQGTGPIIIYGLTYFFGMSILEVLGTGTLPWLVLALSSTAIFALNHIIDYQKGVVLLIGMMIGGYIGAKFALKKGEDWIRIIFTIFVVIAAIKLLFF